MDNRSIVQLVSCLVVFSVVLYHFEVAPSVTLTWENSNADVVVKQPPQNKQVEPHYDPDYGVDVDPYDSELIDELAEEIGNNVMAPKTPPPPVKHAPADPPIEHGVSQKNGLSLQVEIPKALHECFPAKITLTSGVELNYATQLDAMEHLTVRVACENEEDSFEKILLFVPTTNKQLRAVFYPDASTVSCSLHVTASADISLTGDISKDYKVGDIPKERRWCWGCGAHVYRDIPLSYHFLLMDNEGTYLFSKESKSLSRDEVLDLWVVPHPLLRAQYPEIVDKVLFNAWLEARHVIQGTETSYYYDSDRGGYRIRITGKDAGKFKLFVVLNWIYPFSEVGTDDPAPILTSSHIDHSVSPCDLERSEVAGSQFQINVKVDEVLDHELSLFIMPENPRKCTSINEPGRWLNVIPRETDCRPPYCSGDRFSTFISTMSWQGTKHEWLWIPYDCHYHYYSSEHFATCAKELDINWIHVTGDSLPRESVAYLMSLNEVLDTTKFDHADVMLGETGIRITFESWTDIIGRGPGKNILGDQPRSRDFLETIIDHYNIRKMNSSKPIDMWEYNLYQDIEEDSPDVFLANGANAYAMFLQSAKSYEIFVQDIADILGDSLKNGREGDGKKTKMFWYGNPYIHGTAHEGTEHITQGRNRLFDEIAKAPLENVGVHYFDFFHMTHMRPMESWDGLHYLRGYEQWNGHVASTYIQTWLNELFGSCTGE